MAGSAFLRIDPDVIFIGDINMIDHCLILAQTMGYHVSKRLVGDRGTNIS